MTIFRKCGSLVNLTRNVLMKSTRWISMLGFANKGNLTNYHFNLITADPDDNKFVDCAIAANARYIVTNDHHYDVLRQIQFPIVDIMALKDFLNLLHH